MKDTIFDKALHYIRKKYCVRMDADGEEEEEPKKKKTTGWGTRLPYGLCKSLGIETTGMTPSEAWKAYESQTGKSADEMYKEKAEKGEGKVIDVEEKAPETDEPSDSSVTEDYSTWTKEDLQNELSEVQKKLNDMPDIIEDWDEYYGLAQKEKKLIDAIGEKDKPDYSSMSQEELATELDNINNEIQKIYDGAGDLLTDDEMEAIDDLYEKRNELYKYFKGYDVVSDLPEIPKDEDIEPMDDPLGDEPEDTKDLSDSDLENVLGGKVEEFNEAGGFQKSGDGYVNPLTGEYFTQEEKDKIQKSIEKHETPVAESEPEAPVDDILSGDEPKPKKEELQKAISDNDADIETFTNTLKDFGFTDDDINAEDFGKVVEKYEAIGDFYDACQDAVDWKEKNGIQPDDPSWFTKLSDDKQTEFYELYDEANKCGNKLQEYGIYSFATFDGTVEGYDQETVENILEKKDMASYYGGMLKSAKKSKTENEAKLATFGSEGTELEASSPDAPTETAPKKKYKTVKSLQKQIDKTNAELDGLYKKEYTINGKTHTYEGFKSIADDGIVKGVHKVDDIFDRAEKMKAVYDAVDKKNEWLEAHDGKEPVDLLSDGMPYSEYKKLSQEYKALREDVFKAQSECSAYGISFGADGAPTNATKEQVNAQLKWKEQMAPDLQRIKELEAEKVDLDSQLKVKQNKAEIKKLTKEKAELNKKAKELQEELDGMTDKTYHGIWKHPVHTSDYESLNIEGKKDYYNSQLASLGDSEEDKTKKGLYTEYLSQLAELEAEGPVYVAKKKALDQTKAEVNDKQNSINALKGKSSKTFGADSYTKERKDKALWTDSSEEADKVYRDTCGKVWSGASQAERDAIYEYTQSYSKFNEPLRGYVYGTSEYIGPENIDFENIGVDYYTHFKPGEQKKAIRDVTNIIDRSSYDRDVWLQRGCAYNGMDKFFNCDMDLLVNGSTEDLQKLVDTEPIEYGFMSCGTAKGKGMGGSVILNIYAPAGTKMMYAEPFSAYGDGAGHDWNGKDKQHSFGQESEMLMQQGTRFRVTKAERSYGTVYIDIEVIGQNPRRL